MAEMSTVEVKSRGRITDGGGGKEKEGKSSYEDHPT